MPSNKPLLLALAGKAGSGKSTVADYLTQQHGYHQFAFASALKEVVGTAFRLDDEQLSVGRKEEVDPRWGVSPRYLLQWLGTEVLRAKFPGIWINHLRHDILDFLATNGQRPIVVTDVRFKDEALALKRLGAKLVRLERPSVAASIRLPAGATSGAALYNHISETELDGWDGYDLVIYNLGSLQSLFDSITAFLQMESSIVS